MSGRHVLLIASVLGMLVSAPAAQAYVGLDVKVPDEVRDADWLIGNLTWAAGKGGISWSPNFDSEPEASPSGGSANDVREFIAALLPSAVYINASRNLHVDLWLKKTTSGQDVCYGAAAIKGVEVELWAGPVRVAGAPEGAEFRIDFGGKRGEPSRPKEPSDHELCRYRMGAEVAHLAAGTLLTLRIVYRAEVGPHVIATDPGLGSVLRIPTFPPEQALYRMPEIIPVRLPGAPAEGIAERFLAPLQDTIGLFALLGLAGLATAGRAHGLRGRALRRVLVAVIVAALLSSGCLRGPTGGAVSRDGSDAGGLTQSFVDPGDTGLADERNGSIVAQVSNADGLPVSSVFVALLGTEYFTQSDANGIFAFKHLRPGAYAMRLDRQDYVSLERTVSVRAGNVTRVDVTLAYDTTVDGSLRAHRHDTWDDRTEAVLFDEPMEIKRCLDAGCRQNVNEFFIPPAATGDHNIIRPGTSEIEVNLTFDPAVVPFARLGLRLQGNHDPNLNWTLYLPRRSGEPFRIKTAWEMTDVGHQLFSTVRFGIYMMPYDEIKNPSMEETLVRQVGGDWANFVWRPSPSFTLDRVEIKIHRGVLPLEPRHPDHWRGRNEIEILPAKTTEASRDSICAASNTLVNNGNTQWVVMGLPAQVVPVGTTRVVVELLLGWKPQAGVPAIEFGWDLWYKTGETQPVQYVADSPHHRRAPTPVMTSNGQNWTWTIPVLPSEADGVYNKRSAWDFVAVPTDVGASCRDRQLQQGALQLTHQAWAFRDPAAAAG